ncbi:MAG: CdaR family protein [Eubacteriales bacterium]|nr:CdaR family protein [Eubacteriales bacterium]
MSGYPEEEGWRKNLKAFGARLRASLKSNWGLKVVSLLVAIAVWGGLISQDATLTRERVFKDVQINIINNDALLRNGFIVTTGLSTLPAITVHADVPQRVYDSVTPANYNIRLDLSRITSPGEVILPIQSTDTISYGTVTRLSQTEVTVQVEDYITRRRIPVQPIQPAPAEALPDNIYAGNAGIDPSTVVISGPRSLVEGIARVVPAYDITQLTPIIGTQYNAVPFVLTDGNGQEISSPLISVTSENVLLDTLLVEQTFYPQKSVPVNLTGTVTGQAAPGYTIGRITASPKSVRVAGHAEALGKITMADLAAPVDVSGMTETIIRAAKVLRPADAVFISENAVYVTVEILPVSPVDHDMP